jgi:HEAT repeat protein
MHAPSEGPSFGLGDLREALASGDPSRRSNVLLNVRFEPGVEDLVITALQDRSVDVRVAAVRTVARLRMPRAIRTLLDVSLVDIAPAVREEAVAAVGKLLAERIAEASRKTKGRGPAL